MLHNECLYFEVLSMSLENHNGDEISVVLDFVLTLIMFFEWAVMMLLRM